ncbi:2030_t:CDS:1, partial [Racocetra fulgida]
HEARFMDLEQRDKKKTNLIAKLDDDIKKINHEQIVINLLVQSDTSIPKSLINSKSQ